MRVRDYIRHRVLKRPHQLVLRIDEGQGKPLVLVHGLASSSDAWKNFQVQADTNKWRLIAFDLLGFGHSPKPVWLDYSVQQHARALASSMRLLRLGKPAVLIGHSMGCLVAIQIAKRYPKLVKRLILYEPPLFIDLPEYQTHTRSRRRYFAMYQRIADNPNLVLRYTQALGRVAAKLPGHNLSHGTWLPFERSLRNTVMDQVAYHDLLVVNQPVDIIYGRLDRVVTRAEVQKMFAGHTNIKFFTVNAGHKITKRAVRYLLQLIGSK